MSELRPQHLPQKSPFVFTAPWRLVHHMRQAVHYVQFENAARGDARPDDDELLVIAARRLVAKRGAAFIDPLIEIRVRDAFGRWYKRIGVRRLAAFEAYMLTDDWALIKSGYDYADTEYVNLHNKHSKAKLDAIVVKAIERAKKSA